MGPAWARVPKGLAGQWGTSPKEGLRPTMPQKAAGMRIEPPASVPSARGAIPSATATALPPLEPPAVLAGFQGLLVTPSMGLSVTPFQPSSGVVVLPIGTNPWRARAATEGAALFNVVSGSTVCEPRRVGHQGVRKTSLTPTGTPSNRPCGSPRW